MVVFRGKATLCGGGASVVRTRATCYWPHIDRRHSDVVSSLFAVCTVIRRRRHIGSARNTRFCSITYRLRPPEVKLVAFLQAADHARLSKIGPMSRFAIKSHSVTLLFSIS